MVKIVVVDDYKVIRQMICEYIQFIKSDWKIVGQANNGAEAIEVIKENKPDVVIMDVHMPIMDGIEATRIITAEKNCPIVINYTGMADDILKNKALEAGALAYFRKPFELREIIKTIEQIMEITCEQNLA